MLRFDATDAPGAGRVPAGRVLIDGARAPARSATKCCATAGTSRPTGWSCRSWRSTGRPATVEGVPDIITRGFVVDAVAPRPCFSEAPRVLAAIVEARQRRGAHGPRADQGADPGRDARLVPQALGPPAAGAARRDGDLNGVADTSLSRRVSEFVGVRCSRLALLWLVALASYNPTDPVWFFNPAPPAARQLRRPRRRVPRRAVVPAARLRRVPGSVVLGVVGWHYFWCRALDAAYTKAARRRRCSSAASRRFCRSAFDAARRAGPGRSAPAATPATGSAALARDYFNRTGVGDPDPHAACSCGRSCRRSSRSAGCSRRSARMRGPVAAPPGSVPRLARRAPARAAAPRGHREARSKKGRRATRARRSRAAKAASAARREAQRRAGPRRATATRRPRAPSPPVAATPRQGASRRRRRCRSDRTRARQAARRPSASAGDYRAAAADAARRAEDRAQDRRARADGRGAPARGEVPRVLGRRHRRPDPPGAGRHDLRVQARRRREVQQDHRPGRRPLPGDAGRVGADRSHPRQVHRRHPDSQRAARARSRCASCSNRRPTAEPRRKLHAGARQDDPRRAVRHRPGARCRTC